MPYRAATVRARFRAQFDVCLSPSPPSERRATSVPALPSGGRHRYRRGMLHFVRRHAQSKFVKVVLGIIILVFVLWGVEAVVSGGNPLTTVAIVDGKPISQIEIARAERSMAEAYREAYKGNFTPEVRKALNLRQRALDGL